jgi:uncharacterized protein DUF4035
VDVMLSSISGQQFMEWISYAEIEPFGEERADLRMAILAELIAETNRDPKKKSTPYEVSDFMPQFEKKEPISKEDAIAAIDAMMTALVHASGGSKGNGKQ